MTTPNKNDDKKADDVEDGKKFSLGVVSPQVWLEAQDLSYTLKLKKESIRLLKDVNCLFGPGEACAIMGPSGAGKTTLLNSLSCRVGKNVELEGTILANGTPISGPGDFSGWGTVAPQDDVLLPALTAQELLTFSSQLRRGPRERVEALLATFELAERRHVRAANLSGGQRKRLSIAMELVHAPSVLLADEPTSGLDSRVALHVVKALAELARDTMTSVVATIHQPAVDCFLQFDRLLLLAKGSVCFAGPTRRCIEVFKDPDPHAIFPKNPADAAIEVASEGKFVESDQRTHSSDEDDELISTTSQTELFSCSAFCILFKRSALQAFRQQGIFQLRAAAVTGFVYGLIFFQQQNTQERAQLRVASMFLATLMQGLVPGVLTALFVPLERATLRREYFNGVWQLPEYLLSRFFVSSLIHCVGCTIFSTIFYNMIDLNGSFFRFLYPLILLGIIAQMLGLILGGLFSKATLSVPAFLPINISCVMFNGFFFTKSYLTKKAQYVLYPLWYFSFYRYVFALISVNEFENGEFRTCKVEDNDICPYNSYAPNQIPNIHRDVIIKHVLNISINEAKQYYVFVLFAFIFGFGVIMFVLIKHKALRP